MLFAKNFSEEKKLLQLKNITKQYVTGNSTVNALGGVSIEFRKSEFVSILGQSGCGKTTLLNIIGGLDRYTDGDLIINGKSTKTFKDSDWDSYRNHSIGFVFQSYNLIPHQSVLANVELALTLSGVSKAERRRRAKEALERVGLGDQLHKKPNQMSGGQMQRVAIARALVNDPEILLADEPTGALDTSTSVQIMEILKEISKDRLIIMVTHNPELADTYSTRIIKLLDGLVIDDSNPYTSEEKTEVSTAKETKKKKKDKSQKTSMSFLTALSLSFNNLRTKKGRTIMTSFAGSIGIIGIALILALSTGINAFITQVQEDTLSTYPLTIQKQTQDMSAMLSALTSTSDQKDYSESNQIHVDDSLGTMMGAMTSTVENNLEAFKVYLEENNADIKDYVSDIQYTYNYNLQVYNTTNDWITKIGMETVFEHMGDAFSSMSDLMEMGGGINIFSEMIGNQEILDQQYDVIAGNWPAEGKADEVVLVVNSNNQISKMTLYMLGILDPNDIDQEMEDLMSGKYESKEIEPFTYDYFLKDVTFKLLTTADFFEETSKTYTVDGTEYKVWNDLRDMPGFDLEKHVNDSGLDVKIVGIVRPKDGAAATSISGAIGYTKALTNYILDRNAESDVINQQKKTPEINVLTGLTFERTKYTPETIDELVDKIDQATMDMFYAYMTEQIKTNEEFSSMINVKDKDSFSQVFFLLPAENQAVIIEKMLGYSNENTMGMTMLCGTLSAMLKTVNVTPDNIMTLLPILGMQELYVLISGVPASEQMPMAISGLIDLSGEDNMNLLYKETADTLLTLTVNEGIFKTILSTMSAEDEAFIQLEETLYNMAPDIDATYDSVLKALDDAEKASPASVNFYAKDFESKDAIEKFIADYNTKAENEGRDEDILEYTDIVGTLMSSVTVIVNAISYVLIAFVAISLVVSSIMIGIITNISVLERTKEIGILRAIGASKKDISRVFNAETLIIGFAAGAIGIIMTFLLCFPITAIVQYLTGLDNIRAVLPAGSLILVGVSMFLTFFAGLIPASSAAKKDPVIALRTE